MWENIAMDLCFCNESLNMINVCPESNYMSFTFSDTTVNSCDDCFKVQYCFSKGLMNIYYSVLVVLAQP